MKTVAIVQSSFIPWKGYFDLANQVDEFVFFDDVQFTKRDWRSRNYINSKKGLQLLSVPIKVKGRRYQKIYDAEIADKMWGRKHWASIEHSYRSAPFFYEIEKILKPIFLEKKYSLLHKLNKDLIEKISQYLNIKTKFTESARIKSSGYKTDKLIQICKSIGATNYLSGPSAKSYIEEEEFINEGIEVNWVNYDNYPKYKQVNPVFCHNVSIIDVLFNVGPASSKYISSK